MSEAPSFDISPSRPRRATRNRDGYTGCDEERAIMESLERRRRQKTTKRRQRKHDSHIRNLEGKLEELDGQLQESLGDNHRLIRANRKLQRGLATNEDELRHLRSTISTHEAELAGAVESKQLLEAQMNTAQVKIGEMDQSLQEMRGLVDTTQAGSDETEARLQCELGEVQTAHARLQDRFSQAQCDYQDKDDRLEASGQSLLAMRHLANTNEMKLISTKEDLDHMQLELSKCRDENACLQGKFDQVESNHRETDSRVEQTRQSLLEQMQVVAARLDKELRDIPEHHAAFRSRPHPADSDPQTEDYVSQETGTYLHGLLNIIDVSLHQVLKHFREQYVSIRAELDQAQSHLRCKDQYMKALETTWERQQNYIADLGFDDMTVAVPCDPAASNVMGLFTNPMTHVANDNSQQCLSSAGIGSPSFSPSANSLAQGSQVFYASPQLLHEQASVAVGDHALQNEQPQIYCGFDYSANATAYGGVRDPRLQQITSVPSHCEISTVSDHDFGWGIGD